MKDFLYEVDTELSVLFFTIRDSFYSYHIVIYGKAPYERKIYRSVYRLIWA